MKIIQEGRVSVNGKNIREPSVLIDPLKDKAFVDGKPVVTKQFKYVMLNKPAGYVTTKEDVHAEKTVFDLLPASLSYLVPVGRLDKNTEGLLLFTNDGDVTFHLTHPRFEIVKTYEVAIQGALDEKTKEQLEQGVVLEGKKTAPAKIRLLTSTALRSDLTIEIHEGRKRQVRLMFGKVRHKVLYLKRLTQGPLQLGSLEKGKWRDLTEAEISAVRKLIKR